ncbi:unnamed protein product [Schistosoma curassoni]|uniref:K-box domain-containing protein n=1 Tax=Schistosoma curassoni TaxID=6186 RepID=A0A183JBW8_9TREM|nr:unnamed protein product [Schistosoma curassoni]
MLFKIERSMLLNESLTGLRGLWLRNQHLLDHVYPIGQSTLLIQYELFKMELDNYLDRLKQIIEDKNNQLLEQKSINEIDYQFDDQYKHLEIPTLEPFNMVIYGLPNISFA